MPPGTPIAEVDVETEARREDFRAPSILRTDRSTYSGPESRGRFFAPPARRAAPKPRAVAIVPGRMAPGPRPSPRAIDEVARAQYQVAPEAPAAPDEPALP